MWGRLPPPCLPACPSSGCAPRPLPAPPPAEAPPAPNGGPGSMLMQSGFSRVPGGAGGGRGRVRSAALPGRVRDRPRGTGRGRGAARLPALQGPGGSRGPQRGVGSWALPWGGQDPLHRRVPPSWRRCTASTPADAGSGGNLSSALSMVNITVAGAGHGASLAPPLRGPLGHAAPGPPLSLFGVGWGRVGVASGGAGARS